MTQPRRAAHVLVVEDDPDIRSLLEQRIRRLGHASSSAGSAELALVACAERTPDLVLLDLGLPGMDGWGFLDALRATPGGDDVPVIIVSILDDERLDDRPPVAGYLTKPFRNADVDSLLAAHLPKNGAPA